MQLSFYGVIFGTNTIFMANKITKESIMLTTTKIPRALLERVVEYKLRTGVTITHFISQAIEEKLAREGRSYLVK